MSLTEQKVFGKGVLQGVELQETGEFRSLNAQWLDPDAPMYSDMHKRVYDVHLQGKLFTLTEGAHLCTHRDTC